MSSIAATQLDELDIITARRYGERDYPHDEWTRLRRESPVHRFHPEGYEPFFAVTRHADIVEVSKQPELFKSAGRFILVPRPPELQASDGDGLSEDPPLRMLVNMDPPEHRDYRKLVSAWFTPRAIARLETRLHEITSEIFDAWARDGEAVECDLVHDIAAIQPLRMITELLGIPREKEAFVMRVTQENFGIEDPELQRADNAEDGRLGFLTEAFAFLSEITNDRRENPRDDLSTVLAQATLEGQPVPQFELFSLYFLIMVAGHDTTRNAISGGVRAFLEHPDEFAKLQADPGLLETAADEIVRWSTPVNHFSRTATRDTVLNETPIKKGDSVALFYASANRDETIFEDPFAFRIDRTPNPHLGFGIGEHFCLGASLARLDLRIFFEHFAKRVESIEPAGDLELSHASFVGGPKRMPVKIRIRPSQ